MTTDLLIQEARLIIKPELITQEDFMERVNKILDIASSDAAQCLGVVNVGEFLTKATQPLYLTRLHALLERSQDVPSQKTKALDSSSSSSSSATQLAKALLHAINRSGSVTSCLNPSEKRVYLEIQEKQQTEELEHTHKMVTIKEDELWVDKKRKIKHSESVHVKKQVVKNQLGIILSNVEVQKKELLDPDKKKLAYLRKVINIKIQAHKTISEHQEKKLRCQIFSSYLKYLSPENARNATDRQCRLFGLGNHNVGNYEYTTRVINYCNANVSKLEEMVKISSPTVDFIVKFSKTEARVALAWNKLCIHLRYDTSDCRSTDGQLHNISGKMIKFNIWLVDYSDQLSDRFPQLTASEKTVKKRVILKAQRRVKMYREKVLRM